MTAYLEPIHKAETTPPNIMNTIATGTVMSPSLHLWDSAHSTKANIRDGEKSALLAGNQSCQRGSRWLS